MGFSDYFLIVMDFIRYAKTWHPDRAGAWERGRLKAKMR